MTLLSIQQRIPEIGKVSSLMDDSDDSQTSSSINGNGAELSTFLFRRQQQKSSIVEEPDEDDDDSKKQQQSCSHSHTYSNPAHLIPTKDGSEQKDSGDMSIPPPQSSTSSSSSFPVDNDHDNTITNIAVDGIAQRNASPSNQLYPMPVVSSDSEDASSNHGDNNNNNNNNNDEATTTKSPNKVKHKKKHSQPIHLHLDASSSSSGRQSLQFHQPPQSIVTVPSIDDTNNDSMDYHQMKRLDASPSELHDVTPDQQCSASRLDEIFQNAEQADWKPMQVVADPPAPLDQLEIGDHVYQWRSLLGIPYVFQHHGIVINIEYPKPTEEQADDEKHEEQHAADESNDIPMIKVTIADFSNLQSELKQMKQQQQEQEQEDQPPQQENKNLFSITQPGTIRTVTNQEMSTWNKVQYEAPFWKRHLASRAGTSTAKKGDAVGLVLARTHYLLTHPTIIPNYHVLYSNCECVAVWCKTGEWSTLQAASLLETTTAGQIKSTSTLAAAAAHTQVTVPATGIWGWMGYTTKVSLTAYNPYVVPALGAYGLLTVGVPAVLYKKCSRQWQQTTDRLNEAFWQQAMEDPDIFAESLTHWSTLPYVHDETNNTKQNDGNEDSPPLEV